MTIQEEKTPPSNALDLPFDTYLEQHMSNQHKHVIDILKKIDNKDLVNLYKTALYCVFHTEVPFRQMLCSHCIRELFNVIIRRNQKSLEQLKDHLYQTLNELPIITESNIGPEVIKAAIPIDMNALANFHFKVKVFLKKYRPNLREEEILLHVNSVLDAKKELESLRHIDEGKAIRNIRSVVFNYGALLYLKPFHASGK